MKNNTKNNTNKTIKQMFLAASVALTMGVASATNVPGIPGDVFEFSKPGVTDGAVVSGTGVDAIANINSILDAVQTSGGSDLDNAAFWGSSVRKTEVNVFEYDNAAPMIEELIFLVKGEAYGTHTDGVTGIGYHDASKISTFHFSDPSDPSAGGVTSTKKADFLLKTSRSTSGGLYLDGKLSHTKAKASDLMRLLNFTVTDRNSTNDGTSATDTVSTVTYTGPEANISAGIVTDGSYTTDVNTSVVTYNNDSTLETAVTAASLNKQAFVNANDLVALIAAELKTGYILDVEKATANLRAIADHHTGFLSASLVHEAHGLKAVIKNIGYLEAAVGVGKAAKSSCVVGGSTDKESAACTKIGGKFVTLTQSLESVTNAEIMADNYAASIVAINTFADNIISFNNTVDGFDATAEANKINAEFGTITVKSGTDLHDSLAGVANAAPAPTESDISGEGLLTSDLFDIDGIWNSGLDLDNADNDDDINTGTYELNFQ